MVNLFEYLTGKSIKLFQILMIKPYRQTMLLPFRWFSSKLTNKVKNSNTKREPTVSSTMPNGEKLFVVRTSISDVHLQ